MLTVDVVLLATVLFAAVTDLLERRIYNALTLPVIVLGVVFHAVAHPAGAWWEGLAGLAAVGVPFFLFHAIYPAGFGAGDVKLLMAIGAVGGVRIGLSIAVVSVIINGGFSLIALIANGRLGDVFYMLTKRPTRNPVMIPYGLAIALAAVGVLATLSSLPRTELQ